MAKRFRIALPETSLTFLPPIAEVLEYTGYRGGIAGLIKDQATRHMLPIPDPKTISAAYRNTVSWTSADSIVNILKSGFSNEAQGYVADPSLASWRETTLNNNGLLWLCLINDYRLLNFQVDQPETYTEQFIKRRAEQELVLLQEGDELKRSSETSVLFEQRWNETLNDFLSRNTLVEPIYIEQGLQADVVLLSSVGPSRVVQVGKVFGLLTRLRIDFYYQLLCNVSLDLIRWFKQKDGVVGRDQWLVQNSFFGDMVPVIEGDGMTLPFAQLLAAWRRGVRADREVSWAEMAQSMPDPWGLDADKFQGQSWSKQPRAAEIRKNKISRLREWRDRTQPKSDQLERFIRNFSSAHDAVSSAMLLKANVACTWGAFIRRDESMFKDMGLIDTMNETMPAFARFPAYWAEYKSQAADIVAA